MAQFNASEYFDNWHAKIPLEIYAKLWHTTIARIKLCGNCLNKVVSKNIIVPEIPSEWTFSKQTPVHLIAFELVNVLSLAKENTWQFMPQIALVLKRKIVSLLEIAVLRNYDRIRMLDQINIKDTVSIYIIYHRWIYMHFNYIR